MVYWFFFLSPFITLVVLDCYLRWDFISTFSGNNLIYYLTSISLELFMLLSIRKFYHIAKNINLVISSLIVCFLFFIYFSIYAVSYQFYQQYFSFPGTWWLKILLINKEEAFFYILPFISKNLLIYMALTSLALIFFMHKTLGKKRKNKTNKVFFLVSSLILFIVMTGSTLFLKNNKNKLQENVLAFSKLVFKLQSSQEQILADQKFFTFQKRRKSSLPESSLPESSLPERSQERKKALFNGILIINHSLRAKNISFYDYPKNTSPFLKSFLRRNSDSIIKFESAFSNTTDSAVSFASILSGWKTTDNHQKLGDSKMIYEKISESHNVHSSLVSSQSLQQEGLYNFLKKKYT